MNPPLFFKGIFVYRVFFNTVFLPVTEYLTSLNFARKFGKGIKI